MPAGRYQLGATDETRAVADAVQLLYFEEREGKWKNVEHGSCPLYSGTDEFLNQDFKIISIKLLGD